MHFAISVVSALQVLHVLLPSSAVTAQPEPEEGCLLQSPGQLALKAEQVVPAGRIDDLQNLCSGGVGCYCTTIASGARNLDLAGCRSFCFPYPAFSRNLQNNFCSCCRSRETLDAPSGFQLETYQFIRTDLSESGRLNRLCEECRCANSPPPGQPRSLTRVGVSDCGYFCQGLGWTTFSHYPAFQNLPASCTCCEGDEVTNVLNSIPMRASYTILDQPATAIGDPHITTLDGHHYTLMQQGIFSLWHLSGLETQFHSENGLVKTVPVDWQVYTRYAGHQAFTKGLLLVDKSGGAVRQIMEMTSEDCQWRARKGDGEWTIVKDDEEIWVPDGQDYVTGFQVTKKGAKGYKHIHLNVNTKSGKTEKVVLSLSCRPHHNINLQLVMRQRRGMGLQLATAFYARDCKIQSKHSKAVLYSV